MSLASIEEEAFPPLPLLLAPLLLIMFASVAVEPDLQVPLLLDMLAVSLRFLMAVASVRAASLAVPASLVLLSDKLFFAGPEFEPEPEMPSAPETHSRLVVVVIMVLAVVSDFSPFSEQVSALLKLLPVEELSLGLVLAILPEPVCPVS